MQVLEMTKKLKNTLPQPERDELVKKMRKEDDRMVNGMFEFLDAQGGWLSFTYRKYPGEAVKVIRIDHGEICDLPMGIVKQLNNTKKKVRTYKMEMSESGAKAPRSYTVQSRVRFTPMSVL